MPARCYTVKEVCERLQMKRSTFYHLRKNRQLQFLEELRPRLGRQARFRADLIDRYLDGRSVTDITSRRSA